MIVIGGKVRLSIPTNRWELLDPRTGEIAQSSAAPCGEFRFAASETADETQSRWMLCIKAE